MGDYKSLRAWQLARDLAVLSKAAITRLPGEERYALADQWRRAVYSVALNIAEGASRRGVKDFRKHLDIARGSLHEVEAIIELVLAMEYFRPEELERVRATRDECARTVYGLLQTLPNGPKEPGR
jgi:four helix bundle protein